MEPIQFKRVFVNDDEPYQEYVRVVQCFTESDEREQGDHIILSPYALEILCTSLCFYFLLYSKEESSRTYEIPNYHRQVLHILFSKRIHC